jgi:hypothetical protein
MSRQRSGPPRTVTIWWLVQMASLLPARALASLLPAYRWWRLLTLGPRPKIFLRRLTLRTRLTLRSEKRLRGSWTQRFR